MAKNDFPKVKPAEKYPLGNAKENKSADSYTGFVYPQGGGNDIGVYKQPMTVSTEQSAVTMPGNPLGTFNIAVGGVSKGNAKGTNPDGVGKMRGYGAATKGTKISGKMG